jgi:hypothetical protein
MNNIVASPNNEGYVITATPSPPDNIDDNCTMKFIYSEGGNTGQPFWYLDSIKEVTPILLGQPQLLQFSVAVPPPPPTYTYSGFLKDTIIVGVSGGGYKNLNSNFVIPFAIDPKLLIKQVFQVVIYLRFLDKTGTPPPSNTPIHIGDITIPGGIFANNSTNNPKISAVISIYTS